MNVPSAMDFSDLRGPQQWSEDDAKRVLAAWRSSGLSVNAFATRHGLRTKRVLWWRRRFSNWRSREKKKEKAPRLVPAVPISIPRTLPAVAIRLETGAVVEIGDASAVPPEWVLLVARGLAERE